MLNKLLICFAVVLSLPILAGCDDDGYECSTKSRRPGEKLEFKEANFGKVALSSKQPEWRFTEDRLYSRIEVKQEGREKVYWPRKRLMRFLSPHEAEYTDEEYQFSGTLFLDGIKLECVKVFAQMLCGFKCEKDIYLLVMHPFVSMGSDGKVCLPVIYLYKYDKAKGLVPLLLDPYCDDPECFAHRDILINAETIKVMKNMKMEQDYQRLMCFYAIMGSYESMLFWYNDETDIREFVKELGFPNLQYEALKYLLDTFDNNPDILNPSEDTFARHIGILPPGSSYTESIRQERNRLIKYFWEYDFLTDEQRKELRRVLDYIEKP